MRASKVLRFEPNGPEFARLSAADEAIGRLLVQVGEYRLELQPDRFEALARAIVGQQLSLAAARTIWARFVDLVGAASPEAVADSDADSLRSIGLSNAKARYILGLAHDVLAGSIDLEGLDALDDTAVIEQLTLFKGVGRWTAEMFLIFSLGRPDVFSPGDVGLQRAMRWLYDLPEEVAPADLEAIAGAWTPYRSAASLYLWEALNQHLITKGN